MLTFKLFNVFKKASPATRRRGQVSRTAPGYDTFEPRMMLAGDLLGPAPVEHGSFGGTFEQRIIDGTDVDLDNDPYPSVGLVSSVGSNAICTGTLIAPTYVLTAAHCVAGTGPGGTTIQTVGDFEGTFEVGGEVYGTSRVEFHPLYDDTAFFLGYDIALYELDRPVIGIDPSPLYRSVPQVGDELILVGFGNGGTGEEGETGNAGVKRFGTTPIDEVDEQHIRWTFDDDDENPESNTARGDSGGPGFIDVDGTLFVAGITSGGTVGSAFGGTSFDIRVDFFLGYIDEVFSGRDEHADTTDENATFIAHGEDGTTRSSGRLQRAGDRDVYQLQFRQNGSVVFRVNGLDTMDAYVRLYNQDGLLLAENDNFDGLNSRLVVSVQAGTYYFSVSSRTDTETGKFNLWTKLKTFGEAVPADDHSNVADTSATFFGLDDNQVGRHEGRIEVPSDRDVFKITVQNSGTAAVRVTGLEGFDTDLIVYDSLGRVVAQNDDYNGSINAGARFQFVPGTYFVSVGASGGRSTGSYRIWTKFLSVFPKDDHGDFISNSTGLSQNRDGSAFAAGNIDGSRDSDMFFFTANRFSTEMVVRTTSRSADLDTILTVFDSSGKRVGSNDDTFGTDSLVLFAARPGETFYVLVEGKDGSAGEYRLALFSRN